MAGKSDNLTVEIKVNRALREYLVGINGGSSLLRLDWGSELWVAIKSRLQTVPNDYCPQSAEAGPDSIRVELPSTHAGKRLYNLSKGEVIHHDFLFRCFLDSNSQRQVEAILMKGFKKTYRDFMTGAVTTNTDTNIKDAIYTFCDVHHIEMNYVTYEMLRKDWYRYKKREGRGEPCLAVKSEFS
ncbi:MAG: hypothetical protein IJU69_00100 [Bacteroidales bacterium]|nr:hypothetical protein [Bacteroidales bacterium]